MQGEVGPQRWTWSDLGRVTPETPSLTTLDDAFRKQPRYEELQVASFSARQEYISDSGSYCDPPGQRRAEKQLLRNNCCVTSDRHPDLNRGSQWRRVDIC